METSDRTLIERFLSGNREAFGEIVRRWERSVLNLALRLTGDLEESLDIRQQAFLRTFKGISAFNGEARFSTWLFRVVVNLCRDRMRSRRSREEALQGLAGRSLGRVVPPPDTDAERSETARIVADAVKALPMPEREVVVLKHYHERSFSEIAAIVGVPASTVKSRMERGLRHLRGRLKRLDE